MLTLHIRFYDTSDAFKEVKDIEEMVYPDVTDDRVFGFMTESGNQ